MFKMFLFIFFTTYLYSAPALKINKVYLNDGEKLELELIGDEYFHTFKSKNGDFIKYDNNRKKFYKYRIINNKIIFSNTPYMKKYDYDKNFNVNKKELIENSIKLFKYNKNILNK